MTVLGIATAVAVIGIWFLRREWTQFVVGATVVFPQTAALVVGDNGFPLFYLAVVLIAVLSIPYLLLGLAHPGTVRAIASRRGFRPDLLALCLLAWAAVITIAGPRMFAGMRVFAPDLGIDNQVDNMAALAPSLGNIAQLGYLAIATVFLLLAGRLFPVDARLVSTALWLSVVLAAARLVLEPWWPHALLQNMPGFNYATPERLSGTLHEPSVLGLYLTAAAAYFFAKLGKGGRARVGALVGLSLVAVDFYANNSGTAILGLGVIAAMAAGVAIFRLVATSRIGVQPWAIVIGVTVSAAAITQLPLLYSLTVGYAQDKVGSGSFFARGASNLRSWQIFLESYGAGIGLGSNRPSSFFFFVLGCLGVVGVGLLVALIWSALKLAGRGSRFGAAGWTLLGVVVAMTVAVPDLSAPLLWTSISACLAAGYRPREEPTMEGSPAIGAAQGTDINPVPNPSTAIASTPLLPSPQPRRGAVLSPILGAAAHTRLLPTFRSPAVLSSTVPAFPRRAAIPKET